MAGGGKGALLVSKNLTEVIGLEKSSVYSFSKFGRSLTTLVTKKSNFPHSQPQATRRLKRQIDFSCRSASSFQLFNQFYYSKSSQLLQVAFICLIILIIPKKRKSFEIFVATGQKVV